MSATDSDRADRYRQYAQHARQRAAAAWDAEHAIGDRIPFGQPILVGHHSEGRHRRAIDRMRRLATKGIEEQEKAQYWEHRAQYAERREAELERAAEDGLALESVAVGDRVVARFTNNYRVYEFPGVVVGRTKNIWKVRALGSPYAEQGEPPGRVFHIPALGAPKHSTNNCVRLAEEGHDEQH